LRGRKLRKIRAEPRNAPLTTGASRRAQCGTRLIAHSLIPSPNLGRETDRQRWEAVKDVLPAVGTVPGSIVADVGAGDGFLTIRLGPFVGERGRVYAIDIDDIVLESLRRRLAQAHVDNVVVVRGSSDDPHLPAGQLGAAVILNSYHEMPNNLAMLRHIREALKPSGRLAIAEPSPPLKERRRAEQISHHHIGSNFVADEMSLAGFEIIDRRDDFARVPGEGGYSLVVGRRVQ
jgi:precorrin-6B methylase 2